MIGGQQLTKRILISPDFRELQLSIAKKSGTGTITVANGVMTCQSLAVNDSAYAFYNLYLPPGSFAEVICEMKGTGAVNSGGLGYNQFPDRNQNIGGTLLESITADSDWKPYKMIVPADMLNPYTSIMFGVWYNGVATYSFRNVEINVYNGFMMSPEVRFARILGGGNTWTWEEAPNGQRNFGIYDVSVRGTGLLSVKFQPFRNWDNPIVFAQFSTTNNRYGYTVNIGSVTDYYAELQICDPAGNPINASSLSGTNSIMFLAIGL